MERLLRRLNHTWQKLSRDRHLVALYFQLNDAECRLYDFYFAACIWDKTYKETYGTVEFPDREVAILLSWSPSKVCRTRNSLITKGVISLRNGNIYSVIPSPELPDNLNTLGAKTAWVQNLVSSMQQNVSPLKQDVAPVQQTQGYSDDSSIVSYKDKHSLTYPKRVLIKQETRTEEKYQRMYQDDLDGLTPEDMRWIDTNLTEVLEVTEENEQDVVNLYFGGDWSKYRMNLIS